MPQPKMLEPYRFFWLVLAITPCTTKNKNELPATRIHRQCNPKAVEAAFLSVPAIEFFAEEQYQALQDWYSALGQGLEPIDATVKTDRGPCPLRFSCTTFGCLGAPSPPAKVTAVAQTSLQVLVRPRNLKCPCCCCRGMDGGKRSHLLNLCGQLLRLVLIPCQLTDCRWWFESLLVHSGVSSATRRKATGADQKNVLIPCHIKGEPHHWTRSTAISFAAELDGHVLGTLCAVTMLLLTNRLEGVFPRRCPVRNRPQPFATVRSRPREPRMAVPMASSAKGVIFGVSNVALLRLAWQAWHLVTFRCVRNASNVVFCGRRNTFATFSEIRCSFCGRRSTLDVSIVILRGRRNTLDVSCGVIFANSIVRATSSGDKVQIPWQALHFDDVLQIYGSLHETSILR